jgi:hypothetical protein
MSVKSGLDISHSLTFIPIFSEPVENWSLPHRYNSEKPGSPFSYMHYKGYITHAPFTSFPAHTHHLSPSQSQSIPTAVKPTPLRLLCTVLRSLNSSSSPVLSTRRLIQLLLLLGRNFRIQLHILAILSVVLQILERVLPHTAERRGRVFSNR